ncbi:MAG: GatB/YqeY domain-containing protein [Patescibacteria group bacterium]
MEIEKKLNEDMKTAMKSKDASTLEVLRMTISSIRNKAIEVGKELADAEVLAVIKSDAKKIKDALESFVQNAREDLATKARQELEILERYLPAQMSDADLDLHVRAKVQELGVTDPSAAGKVMGVLSKELQGQADGSRIKAALDRILAA